MSITTYHITKKGNPGPCRAKPGNCPLGGQHFATMKEATDKHEKDLRKQYGSTVTFNKSLKYKFYNKIDNSKQSRDLHRSLRILKKSSKGLAVVGVAAGAVAFGVAKTAFKITRFTASKILKTPMRKRSRLNAKKLLLTKYWFPDIHSNKWR